MQISRRSIRHVPLAGALVLLLGLAAAAAAPGSIAQAATAQTTDAFPLVVTEITPDTVGYDNFEFFEVTNTTDVDIDLTAAGIGLSYIFADSDDRVKDVPFTVPANTVVAAADSTVFWVDYTSGNVDTSLVTEDDFRAHFTAIGAPAAEYPVVRVTGQPKFSRLPHAPTLPTQCITFFVISSGSNHGTFGTTTPRACSRFSASWLHLPPTGLLLLSTSSPSRLRISG